MAQGDQMETLYVGDKYVCQTVIWPPRFMAFGWELDVLCSQELLGMFPHMARCVFRVNDVEFTGLEAITTDTVIVPADEMVKATLIFQHCVTVEMIGREGRCSHESQPTDQKPETHNQTAR